MRQDDMFFEFYYDMLGVQRAKLTRAVKSKIQPNVVIPAFVEGVPVCTICPDAFAGCKSIESIEFPESIDAIHARAFKDCANLKTVTSYGSGFIMPAAYVNIYASAFNNCIQLVKFQSTVPIRSLESFAFKNCRVLTELDAKIKIFEGGVFENCHELSKVIVDDRGTWKPNSFAYAKKLKVLVMKNTVDVSQSALRAIKNKSILCTEKFNHLELAYEGAKMCISDDV